MLRHHSPRPQLWILVWSLEGAHCAPLGVVGQPILCSQRTWSFGKDLRIFPLLQHPAELPSHRRTVEPQLKTRDWTYFYSQFLSFQTGWGRLKVCKGLSQVVLTAKDRWTHQPRWDLESRLGASRKSLKGHMPRLNLAWGEIGLPPPFVQEWQLGSLRQTIVWQHYQQEVARARSYITWNREPLWLQSQLLAGHSCLELQWSRCKTYSRWSPRRPLAVRTWPYWTRR